MLHKYSREPDQKCHCELVSNSPCPSDHCQSCRATLRAQPLADLLAELLAELLSELLSELSHGHSSATARAFVRTAVCAQPAVRAAVRMFNEANRRLAELMDNLKLQRKNLEESMAPLDITMQIRTHKPHHNP